jgi:excisionase family DNA binding protein
MYTTKEFCEMFKISRQTFQAWVKKGLVNVVQVDRLIRVTEEEVQRLKNLNK